MTTDLDLALTPGHTLPEDHRDAALAGRVWRPELGGPSVVAIRHEGVFDITAAFPTMRDLCEAEHPAGLARAPRASSIGALAELLANTPPERARSDEALAARADRPAGDQGRRRHLRDLDARARDRGAGARRPRQAPARSAPRSCACSATTSPSSSRARRRPCALKSVLIAQGAVVAISRGRHRPGRRNLHQGAADVGGRHRADVGCIPARPGTIPSPRSCSWCSSNGAIVGATLGNDVNLRDFEGRSALLLSKAKDNNASCAIGPFVRLFDESFSLDDVRAHDVSLAVEGEDGFRLEGASLDAPRSAATPPTSSGQMIDAHHQYPDGVVLFLGTMFAPVEDRDAKGKGFTHKLGDIVTIASPQLGRLVNRMRHTGSMRALGFWGRGADAEFGKAGGDLRGYHHAYGTKPETRC